METIVVTFKRVIYQSIQNGVCIAGYEVDGRAITVTGIGLPSTKNISYEMNGSWIEHPKYGRQFKCESFEEKIGDNAESLFAYLTSGLIKGIGPATASAIIKKFGMDTIDILDKNISRLLEIRGISEGKLLKIEESYKLVRASRETIQVLAKYGISPKLAQACYFKYQNDIKTVIENTPYLLCTVPGITFVQADAIAIKTKEYCTSYERFKTCAKYVMFNNEKNGLKSIIGNRVAGSLGMDKNDFGTCMLTLLQGEGVDGRFVCENTIRMIKDKELLFRKNDEQEVIILPGIYRIEQSIATNIYRLLHSGVKPLDNIEKKISAAEDALHISLSSMQKKAVTNAFGYGFSIITGPPGTGKTTITKVIEWIYEKYEGPNKVFLAPSGKAAARIRENGTEEATTIHSGLGLTTDIISDVSDEEIKIEDSLVVVDEFSMVDARLAYKLFSSIGNCRVIIVGDEEQLPSVGAGSVLRDLLSIDKLPTTYLDTIHRTDEHGVIYQNCQMIRKGIPDVSFSETFLMLENTEIEEVENTLVDTYIEKVERYGIDNVMLLSPYINHVAGVNALNQKIQAKINPCNVKEKMYKHGDGYYMIGDPIMHLVNDHETGVSNGDVGYVSDITKVDGEETVIVKYQNASYVYTKDNINEMTLAYAMSVHKSQGSESKCVILACHSQFSLLQKRNLVYTGISRGKDEIIIVGQKDALQKAIKSEDKSKRITTLKDQMRMLFSEFVSITYASA